MGQLPNAFHIPDPIDTSIILWKFWVFFHHSSLFVIFLTLLNFFVIWSYLRMLCVCIVHYKAFQWEISLQSVYVIRKDWFQQQTQWTGTWILSLKRWVSFLVLLHIEYYRRYTHSHTHVFSGIMCIHLVSAWNVFG